MLHDNTNAGEEPTWACLSWFYGYRIANEDQVGSVVVELLTSTNDQILKALV